MPEETMNYFLSDTCFSSNLMHDQLRYSQVQLTTSSAFPFPSGISSLNSVSFSSFHCCLSSSWNVKVTILFSDCKQFMLKDLVLWSLLLKVVNGYVLHMRLNFYFFNVTCKQGFRFDFRINVPRIPLQEKIFRCSL